MAAVWKSENISAISVVALPVAHNWDSVSIDMMWLLISTEEEEDNTDTQDYQERLRGFKHQTLNSRLFRCSGGMSWLVWTNYEKKTTKKTPILTPRFNWTHLGYVKSHSSSAVLTLWLFIPRVKQKKPIIKENIYSQTLVPFTLSSVGIMRQKLVFPNKSRVLK